MGIGGDGDAELSPVHLQAHLPIARVGDTEHWDMAVTCPSAPAMPWWSAPGWWPLLSTSLPHFTAAALQLHSQGAADAIPCTECPVAHRCSCPLPSHEPCGAGSPRLGCIGPWALFISAARPGNHSAARAAWPGPCGHPTPCPEFVLARAEEQSWFNWQLCLWPGCYEKVFCLPL